MHSAPGQVRPNAGLVQPAEQAVHNRAMDDIVKQALVKWPNVPACYGWLGLDARARWYLRDEAVQAAGSFPDSRGSELQHGKLVEFIQRNYESDRFGRWFFQNGPQRVYVELESTPWIWRIQPDGSLQSHTGRLAVPENCLLDEEGRVYFSTGLGLGLVHSQDVIQVADGIEKGLWNPVSVRSAALPDQYGFIRSPAQTQTPG